MVHLVSYDLIKPVKDYAKLETRLKQLDAKKVLLSQWVLVSPSDAAAIWTDLRTYVDSNDRLLVLQLRRAGAWNDHSLLVSDDEMRYVLQMAGA